MDRFTPAAEGANFEFSPILRPCNPSAIAWWW